MTIINSVIKGGGSAPAYYIEKTKDANGVAQNGSYLMDLSTFTDVGDYVFTYAYRNVTTISGAVDLSSLTTLSGNYACYNMFGGCTGITSIDLSSLTTISGQNACQGTFSGCTGITSIDLSALTTVSAQYGFQQMFNGCTNLTSIDLSSLTTITGQQALSNAFAQTGLTSLSFPALTSTSFGSYTNQLNNMLSGVTGCTVRFPSNLQSVIGSWTSVTLGFSGTNTTVLFDLPSTVILTGADTVEYERNPKNDTATALAWRINGTMPDVATTYYTSGLTDPAVSDTIYSDSACTTPVTTISSIA